MDPKRPDRIRGTTPQVERAAQVLRNEPTPSELVLWGVLRKQQLGGLRFRRQHPVGRFILDFYCPRAKLAVELDGGVHDDQEGRDAERTAVLESMGYRVLRFRNEEVLNGLTTVLQRIEEAARS